MEPTRPPRQRWLQGSLWVSGASLELDARFASHQDFVPILSCLGNDGLKWKLVTRELLPGVQGRGAAVKCIGNPSIDMRRASLQQSPPSDHPHLTTWELGKLPPRVQARAAETWKHNLEK